MFTVHLHYVSGVILGALKILSYLFPTINLQDRYYYPRFAVT